MMWRAVGMLIVAFGIWQITASCATAQSARRVAQAPAAKPPVAAGAEQSRASLGVALSDNTRGGVLILRVLPRSPAAQIGLQTGDRIMSIGGQPVANYKDVARLIAGYRPNDRVELKIDRGGWSKTLNVSLGNASALAVPVAPAQQAVAPPAPARMTPGALLQRPFYEDETPADIDDQHGYGG